ncbi:hypothetical protein GCM10009841_20640 [Microlunatus panaciterrae]
MHARWRPTRTAGVQALTGLDQWISWRATNPHCATALRGEHMRRSILSICRAVLSEGPAGRVLLPTHIRLATAKTDLDHQIAPGLPNAHVYEIQVEEVGGQGRLAR